MNLTLADLASRPPFFSLPESTNEYDQVKPGEKRCRTCNDSKPMDQFVKDASRKDGYEGECKSCKRIRSKKEYRDKKDAKGNDAK